jgi:hypothetical protein
MVSNKCRRWSIVVRCVRWRLQKITISSRSMTRRWTRAHHWSSWSFVGITTFTKQSVFIAYHLPFFPTWRNCKWVCAATHFALLWNLEGFDRRLVTVLQNISAIRNCRHCNTLRSKRACFVIDLSCCCYNIVCRRDCWLMPAFYRSWIAAFGPPTPRFWLLFQAYERGQVRGTTGCLCLTWWLMWFVLCRARTGGASSQFGDPQDRVCCWTSSIVVECTYRA